MNNKSIKYAWKEEGKEPEESEYKENYKVEQYKKGQEIESEELYEWKIQFIYKNRR